MKTIQISRSIPISLMVETEIYSASGISASNYLKEGSSGDTVIFVKKFLKSMGYSSAFAPINENNKVYDLNTATNVRLFQKEFGLTYDGIWGPECDNAAKIISAALKDTAADLLPSQITHIKQLGAGFLATARIAQSAAQGGEPTVTTPAITTPGIVSEYTLPYYDSASCTANNGVWVPNTNTCMRATQTPAPDATGKVVKPQIPWKPILISVGAGLGLLLLIVGLTRRPNVPSY